MRSPKGPCVHLEPLRILRDSSQAVADRFVQGHLEAALGATHLFADHLLRIVIERNGGPHDDSIMMMQEYAVKTASRAFLSPEQKKERPYGRSPV